MHTQLSDSWFREVHRSKIGLHCPRLDLLEAVPHIGLDLQSGAHADRDAGTAFANGDQGSCDVLGLKRLLSLNVARVDMQNTRPCCKDALRILGQFLWRNGECRMFARSPTPIEASLQEHVGVPFLSSSFLL